MKLTREEQEMLDGKHGDTLQKTMELLVAVGDCYGAEYMVPITSAHLSATNPVSGGVGGTKFIQQIADGGRKFVVPTTTNPGSHPVEWREMGFSEEIYRRQTELSDAIVKMGGFACNTCTPYLIGHVPMKGTHIAWCESSAILYSNAVLGSRTNREAGPTAMAAALTGRTPAYGYHLDENRYGKLKIKVSAPLKTESDYATLGYFAGKIAQDRVPVFTGISPSTSQDEFKCLGASLSTSGMVSVYHAIGLTPEAPTEEAACGGKKIGPSDTLEFGPKELRETEESLSKARIEDVDLVVLGCPHSSIEQIKGYAEAFSGRRVKDSVDVWIQIAHEMKTYAQDLGYASIIEASGARLISNTCIAVMPRDYFTKRGYRAVAADAPKIIYYTSVTKDLPCYYDSLDKFIDVITTKE